MSEQSARYVFKLDSVGAFYSTRVHLMIGKIPSKLDIVGSRNSVTMDVMPKGDLWTHLVMRLDIYDENKKLLKTGECVRCATSEPAVVKTSCEGLGERVPAFINLIVKTIQPMTSKSSVFPSQAKWITVGNSTHKKLHIPQEVFATFPAQLKALFLENPRPHFKDLEEKNLADLALLDNISTQHFNRCGSFSEDQLFRCGTFFVRVANMAEVHVKSPLFTFHRNFQKMSHVYSLEVYNETIKNQNVRGTPSYKPEFYKPIGVKTWIDVINGNRALKPQGDWMLRLFTTTYDGVEYLGYSLVSQTKRELCKFNMTLELKGFIEIEGRSRRVTLKLELTPHGSQAQYSYGSPVLATMDEIRRIGMDHEWATVTLKFKNKGIRNTDANVVKFNGINNYVIKTDDVEIHINREVLLKNSEYFVTMCDNDFEEDNRDGCTLHGDDKDALVLCFKILYGCGAPLNYELLGNVLLVADKYAFVDIVKYLDTMMTSLARTNRLPQAWLDQITEIADRCSLLVLKTYIDELSPEQLVSTVDPEDGHYGLLVGLGLYVEKSNGPSLINEGDIEMTRIKAIMVPERSPQSETPAKIAKRPLQNDDESTPAAKKFRLFE